MGKKDKEKTEKEVKEPTPLVCKRCGSIMPKTGCVCCNRH